MSCRDIVGLAGVSPVTVPSLCVVRGRAVLPVCALLASPDGRVMSSLASSSAWPQDCPSSQPSYGSSRKGRRKEEAGARSFLK